MIENVFGILVSRWRVLRKPFRAHPDAIDRVTMACVCLHNFIRLKDKNIPISRRNDDPQNYNVEDNGLDDPNSYNILRDQLATYLTGPGAVPWQDEYVNQGHAPDFRH